MVIAHVFDFDNVLPKTFGDRFFDISIDGYKASKIRSISFAEEFENLDIGGYHIEMDDQLSVMFLNKDKNIIFRGQIIVIVEYDELEDEEET